MEEIKATRNHNVGIRPFNEDNAEQHMIMQINKNELVSGFYLFHILECRHKQSLQQFVH